MRFAFLLIIILINMSVQAQRIRDFGIEPGVLPTGKWNAITDVEGVRVGQVTLIAGDSVRTGVTAILPHPENIFQQKVPAAIHIGNGFGKLMGISQVRELGNIETPIVLTNTLSVPTAANAVIDFVLEKNADVRSVNAVVGETNDGYLNDIRGRHVQEQHVLQAIAEAKNGPVQEGNMGAGTGTRCFGWKGGIGTSSRTLPETMGSFTVGVLVQTNFGGVLQIDGVPVGEELGKYFLADQLNEDADGSCMIVVATDAPVDARNLERVAKRAMLGLARTGGIASNGSGDYVIAFSTAASLLIPYYVGAEFYETKTLHNDHLSPLFLATIEATEEAILNSLVAAETMSGHKNRKIEALPMERVKEILKKYGR
ncbi:MAG: P1 family peptidase [Bacteroidota bacterium]